MLEPLGRNPRPAVTDAAGGRGPGRPVMICSDSQLVLAAPRPSLLAQTSPHLLSPLPDRAAPPARPSPLPAVRGGRVPHVDCSLSIGSATTGHLGRIHARGSPTSPGLPAAASDLGVDGRVGGRRGPRRRSRSLHRVTGQSH